MHKRTFAAAAAVAAGLAAILAAGCSSGDQGSGSGSASRPGRTLNVVATTTQVQDFTRNVGGDRVKVTGILKPNVDAHDYEPSPADLDAVARADVLVKNGVGLEPWLDDVARSAGFQGTVVDASRGVAIRAGQASEGQKEGDPHIWQNPRNAKIMASNIEQGLAKAEPAAAPVFKASLAAYAAKLDALDAQVAAQVKGLSNKKVVTNHDAFSYYLNRYGLELVGSVIPSFDTSAELSGREVQDLVAKIKAAKVKAIFAESSLPPKTAATVAREAGVRIVEGNDALYGDALGPAGSDGDTYIKSVEHNTKTIVSALSGI
ncbi:MAG TPA: metal ABC transporter substrate-binding protein [Actinomycetes bacterium]|nr:metal ABC transporter substrate-binding protein [Actinomycetes bacterium]